MRNEKQSFLKDGNETHVSVIAGLSTRCGIPRATVLASLVFIGLQLHNHILPDIFAPKNKNVSLRIWQFKDRLKK